MLNVFVNKQDFSNYILIPFYSIW